MNLRVAFPVLAALACVTATAGATAPTPASFSNTRLTWPLTRPFPGITSDTTGGSEPSIAIGADGRAVIAGISWIPAQTNVWAARAGSAPAAFGAFDQVDVSGNGRFAVGGFDQDVAIGSAGTTHIAELVVVATATVPGDTGLGVAEINCPADATTPGQCSTQTLDTAGADRPWITSDGNSAWLTYHDARDSQLVRVKRSTDDGATWSHAGSPIPGQGAATGDATFNNVNGPIVSDPTTGDLFDIYAAGEPGIQKATSTALNNIYVSRSSDSGKSWTSVRVFSAPLFTSLNNILPSLAADPVTGVLYATWTDTHGVAVSTSTDHGTTWSPPRIVSGMQTTVMPSVAAYGGKVDVVYYGTSSSSVNDSGAVWNTYDAQLLNGTWTQLQVSQTPNHIGGICLSGAACPNENESRTLLDLFEVAENPLTGKATVVYADDTFHTWTLQGTTYPLPEIVLAQEN